MLRPRPRTAFVAALASATSVVLAAPAPARPAAPAPTHTITVDRTATGPVIDDRMYGVFFEDINLGADGGLYAELVRNRSFEFSPADNPTYTGLTGWATTATGGGTGTAATADDDARLDERNRTYLTLGLANPPGGEFGLTNSGYGTGIPVTAGRLYDFSIWARTDTPGGIPLTVDLGAGAPLRLTVAGDTWTNYRGTLRATRSTDAGHLSVTAAGAGTLRLDMVSLFPRDTFRGRPNGLRRDLADKIAALRPGFIRFPGGCLVNTGSMYGYDASSNWERARAYQWKDTVGPVETRPANRNFWGYNQSYGLGYYELFQFAEDIGAMPLPVVPALVTGCGQNRATDDEALLRRHIQDTLDLIEFANGPAGSTWGRVRASMGHPAPFGLTHLAVGNEENLPDEYFTRFERFRAAIGERYPGIVVVGNSGPDDQGPTFDRLWTLNRQAGVRMVDEHYYNGPAWFLQNNTRYDGYDRAGPQVFLGEYASQGNRLHNSLAEAAFMTGLERNADVVRMASYAPLLAAVDNVQWRPDLIWFDNDESWGSTSYETQKLFMTNVGDRVVPSRFTGPTVGPQPVTGAIGLSTWATAAAYDDVRVTAPDGTVLFSDDFAGTAERWTPLANRGSWSIVDGEFVQSDPAALDTLVRAVDPGTSEYDLTVRARKISGAEGFLVAFGVRDSGNFYWWNLGGWNNTQGAVEKATGGGKEQLLVKPNSVVTGATYDLRIEVRGLRVSLYLNGELWGSFVDDRVTQPFAQVVTHDDRTGELILKVVNARDSAAVTRIDLGRRPARRTARATVIGGDPAAENTRTARPVAPVTHRVGGIGRTFTHTFPPNSVTFLRIR